MSTVLFSTMKFKILIIIFSFFIILFLIWSNSFDQINDILTQINLYEERIVHLQGEPVNTFSLPFTGSLYKLNDKSGSIWVISKIDSIDKDKRIFLSGKIKTHINIDFPIDEKLKQYNLNINHLGPVVMELQREDFISTIKNIVK